MKTDILGMQVIFTCLFSRMWMFAESDFAAYRAPNDMFRFLDRPPFLSDFSHQGE